MSKKKSKNKMLGSSNILEELDKHVGNEDIYEHSKECKLRHGANINLARAFTSVEDGLKISFRRILYSLFVSNRTNKMLKVSKIMGDCLSNFHPHGDTAITDSIVRLANFWELPYPLIQGEGNFGGVRKGSKAHAADRYISAKMSEFAKDCYFSEWTDNIVNMKDNYDGLGKEPEYLPCKYPMALINGSSGMGYSIANDVPIFNFTDVCEATIAIIKEPDYETELIPDSPLECEMILDKNKDTVKRINDYGAGASYKFRAKAKVVKDKRSGRDIIKVGPYLPFKMLLVNDGYKPNVKGTGAPGFLRAIKEAIDEKKLTGIEDYNITNGDDDEIRDIDLELVIKSGFNAQDILNKMYMIGILQVSYNVNMRYVIDTVGNELLSPKEVIEEWIKVRRVTKSRLINSRLNKSMKRAHTLESIIEVIDTMDVDKIIKTIRKTRGLDNVKKALVKLGMSSLQASSVAGLTISAFNEESLENYKTELDRLTKEDIPYYKGLKMDISKLDEIIIEELKEGIKKWGRPRKAEIISDVDIKVSDIECLVGFSNRGYIKKVPTSLPMNKIGSRSDSLYNTIPMNNKDEITILTITGRIFKFPLHNIPMSDRNDSGYLMSQYCKYEEGDLPLSVHTSKEFAKSKFYITLSKEGLIRRVKAQVIGDSKNNTCGAKLTNDELVFGGLGKTTDNVIIHTNMGKYIMMSVKDIPLVASKLAKGSKAMSLEDGEFITGAYVTETQEADRLVITHRGFTKIVSNFKISDRAGKVNMLIRLEPEDYVVRIVDVKGKNMTLTDKTGLPVQVNIKDIPKLGGIAKGVKQFNVGLFI